MDGLQLLKCRLAGQMVQEIEKVPEAKQGKTIKEARTMLTRVLVDMGVVRGRGAQEEIEEENETVVVPPGQPETTVPTPKKKRK